jgi:hypothetical protein
LMHRLLPLLCSCLNYCCRARPGGLPAAQQGLVAAYAALVMTANDKD